MLVHIYIYIMYVYISIYIVELLSSLLLSLLFSLFLLYVTLTIINYMRTVLCHTDVSLLGEVGRSSAQGRVGVQGPVTPGRNRSSRPGKTSAANGEDAPKGIPKKYLFNMICVYIIIYDYIYIYIHILCILDVIYALCICYLILFCNRLHFFVVLLLIQKPKSGP